MREPATQTNRGTRLEQQVQPELTDPHRRHQPGGVRVVVAQPESSGHVATEVLAEDLLAHHDVGAHCGPVAARIGPCEVLCAHNCARTSNLNAELYLLLRLFSVAQHHGALQSLHYGSHWGQRFSPEPPILFSWCLCLRRRPKHPPLCLPSSPLCALCQWSYLVSTHVFSELILCRSSSSWYA